MQIGVATVENSMEGSQKILKIESPFDPAIPRLGSIYIYIYEETQNTNRKEYMGPSPIFTAALSAITKIWTQPKCPSVMGKKAVRCIHTYICLTAFIYLYVDIDRYRYIWMDIVKYYSVIKNN